MKIENHFRGYFLEFFYKYISQKFFIIPVEVLLLF